jgi:hypothetical protein
MRNKYSLRTDNDNKYSRCCQVIPSNTNSVSNSSIIHPHTGGSMKLRLLLLAALMLLCSMIGLAQTGLQLTEILYDIPSGADPNGDGTRQAAGDEFFELYNNSTSPIDLSGYVMIEREGFVVFTFPVGATLGAGKFAVVFGNAITTNWGGTMPAGTLKFSHYTGATDQGFGPVTTRQGTTKTNLASNGDRVMIVNPLLADTVAEIAYGYDNATPPQVVKPLSKKGIYLAGANTVKGDTIQGQIRMSITVQRATEIGRASCRERVY